MIDRRRRAAFREAEVVRCYRFRPPYPAALFDAILDLTPGRDAVLDLGCGPGKLAGPLARQFRRVDAVDPSQAMLDAAAERYRSDRITWHCAHAEDAALAPPYDLACAGASIHWMDLDRLMPRLTSMLGREAWLMVVDGDGAWRPPWQEPWNAFIARWLQRMGRRMDEPAFDAAMQGYRRWLDTAGDEVFMSEATQPVGEFIACQHSRASWAPAAMGRERLDAFDAELTALLEPYQRAGALRYRVRTTLTWGRPSATPR